MKSYIAGAVLAAIATLATVPARAAEVGVLVSISQPGVYGRVDIGRFPQPEVVVQQPIIIQRPRYDPPQPVYMWVPPGHRANWRRYCGEYRACGVPVYFVRDEWYGEHVRPHGRDFHEDRHDDRRDDRDDKGHGKGKYKDKGKDKDHGDKHRD